MQSIIPIADIDRKGSSVVNLETDFDSISTFIFNDTEQSVNNSFCDISSLEVYRGREQAIEISHEGFCLSDDGSIEVGDPKHIMHDYFTY